MTAILESLRMEFFLDSYQYYLRMPGVKQISFDEFCDTYDKIICTHHNLN